MIPNFFKKNLKKTKYWQRNGSFTFSPEVKLHLLIDSPMAHMQSTKTIFVGITCTRMSRIGYSVDQCHCSDYRLTTEGRKKLR